MYLKEQASLIVPPIKEKYTTYQILIERHKPIKEMYFFGYFYYFNKPI